MTWARRLYRWTRNALALFGLLIVLVTLTPLVEWWSARLAGDWPDPRGEVLIVLGSGVIDRDLLAADSYWRAVYAWRAWRLGTFRQIVVCGKDVAPLLREFLAAKGVPAEAIVVDAESATTRENALRVAALLAADRRSKTLLTSDYHMYRAHRAFAKAGLTVTPMPYPDGLKRVTARTQRWLVFLDLIEETGKIVYYRYKGWI